MPAGPTPVAPVGDEVVGSPEATPVWSGCQTRSRSSNQRPAEDSIARYKEEHYEGGRTRSWLKVKQPQLD